MHLLDVTTMRLKKYVEEINGIVVENYAILSHRWLSKDEEVLYQDIESGEHRYKKKDGYYKVKMCCEQARHAGLKYVWIDSCCINKLDSAELQEAINSMYRYYKHADVCYVYLKDTTRILGMEIIFKPGEKEDWFERGWTLQELIAPRKLYFFDKYWKYLGSKWDLSETIHEITGIDTKMLMNGELSIFPVAQRMSWAAGRKATKSEDLAYSLIGLFGVNMPMLYGEGGEKAFLRLQEEIIKTSDDHSIFAWKGLTRCSGLLATSVNAFREFGEIRRINSLYGSRTRSLPFSMTNIGLSITLPLQPWVQDTYLALLECEATMENFSLFQLGIFLRRSWADNQYTRVSVDGEDIYWKEITSREDGSRIQLDPTEQRSVSIFVRQDRYTHPYDAKIHNGFLLQNVLAGSSWVRGRWDPRRRTITFKPGTCEWRNLGELSLSRCGNIRLAKLGFDFDFNATILLCETTVDPEVDFSIDPPATLDSNGTMSIWRDSHGVLLDWNRVESGQASENPRRGLWALKADRLDGLTVRLGNTNIKVVIKKKPLKYIGYNQGWVLRIVDGEQMAYKHEYPEDNVNSESEDDSEDQHSSLDDDYAYSEDGRLEASCEI